MDFHLLTTYVTVQIEDRADTVYVNQFSHAFISVLDSQASHRDYSVMIRLSN